MHRHPCPARGHRCENDFVPAEENASRGSSSERTSGDDQTVLIHNLPDGIPQIREVNRRRHWSSLKA
jgi:hypothetical protein